MNGLRRLTLIYHFISLIQLRAAGVARTAISPLSRQPISSLHPRPRAIRVRVRVCVCVRACVPLLALTPDQLFRWPKRRKKSASGRENVKRANANL